MAPPPLVGIDLGTTFSSIAYINQHGKSEILINREGERITPSVVLLDGDEPSVGTMAKRSAAASPLNVCQFVKRKMGEPDWRFIAEDDKEYTAEEVSALILRRLVGDAETVLDASITEAVVTVPAYFNDAQRKATQDAGRIAGLESVRLINEPTAAAIAYGLDESEEHTVMVYDLGGGTFDVTIMRCGGSETRVIATHGDKNLGGFDWDNALMVELNERFMEEGGADLFEDLATEHDLRDKSEVAKRTLSQVAEAKVFLAAGGKTVPVSISRERFEEVTADLMDRTADMVRETLEDASMEWSGIEKVLLVGGSTRMPAVASLIESLSGRKPSLELNPDEVVSEGAAMYAGVLARQAEESAVGDPGAAGLPAPRPELAGLPATSIVDVNSHSLGVVAVRDDDNGREQHFNSIILPRNTALCTPRSETYGTMQDSQRQIRVEVTEGEGDDLVYVRRLGEGYMELPPYPKGAPITTTLEYDADGIIHVTVVDGTTGETLGEMKLKREANRSDEEVDEMRQEMAATTVR